MTSIKKIFTQVTNKQCSEFGVVTILVAALLGLYNHHNGYTVAVVIFSLITLVAPLTFYPFAVFWFGLSKILSAISSRVLLTIIYFVVVTPVGLLRKLSKADSLKIKQFKAGTQSAMITRDHVCKREDLEHTF